MGLNWGLVGRVSAAVVRLSHLMQRTYGRVGSARTSDPHLSQYMAVIMIGSSRSASLPHVGFIDRLHAFATLSARRAAAAADDLTEPDPDRLARTASAVRQVWAGPRYTALAEAIVASPAFPALAWRLHELEERGYAFTDVLGRIDPDRLMGPNVRDPAALAEWFVEQMAPD